MTVLASEILGSDRPLVEALMQRLGWLPSRDSTLATRTYEVTRFESSGKIVNVETEN